MTALEATRRHAPATRIEYRIRYNACRAVGAKHNALHLVSCKATRVPAVAIRCAWPDAIEGAAIALANCESTANDPTPWPNHGIYAVNGEYVGLFQMGIGEREGTIWYVAGDSAYTQALAGYKLYQSRQFGPWNGHGCR